MAHGGSGARRPVGRAKSLEALSLRSSTVTFMRSEYQETYPYRNVFEAKNNLRSQVYPTNEFVKSFSTQPLREPRLYDLRIHHNSSARTRTAKRLEEEQAAASAGSAHGRKKSAVKDPTSAERVRQLCEELQRSSQSLDRPPYL
mmetsp:Transcript_108361/g.303529  ORF Transcript_108361/g.303529 Transcript_108361/m.303529 type:complete len:144 (-) Transcript_108361:148-579(-)